VRDVVRRSFRWRVPQPWYLISLLAQLLILRRCDVAGRVQWCQSAGYRMTDELATELANALRELVAREADRVFNLALQIVRREAASDGPPLLPTVAERQARKEAPADADAAACRASRRSSKPDCDRGDPRRFDRLTEWSTPSSAAGPRNNGARSSARPECPVVLARRRTCGCTG
jgi:hypothetical protein